MMITSPAPMVSIRLTLRMLWLPHFDVLRATPHALLIARQRANRERASLFGGVGSHALVNVRIALEDDFEDALLMAWRVDHVGNVRLNGIVRIWGGIDGAELVASVRVRSHVAVQTRVAVVVGLRHVRPSPVRMIDVDGSADQR